MRSNSVYAVSEDILNTLEAHIAVLDHAGVITFVNDAWTRFAAENSGDITSCGVGANYINVARAALDDPIAMSVANGIKDILAGRRASFSAEYPYDSPDEQRWFAVTASPLATKPGVIVVHTEMSHIHLARQTSSLEDRRISKLIRYASDLISIISLDGHITYISPSLEHLLGYRPAELIGQPAFVFTHPNDAGQAKNTFAKVANIPLSQASSEIRVKHRSGKWRVLELTYTNLCDDPDIAGVVIRSIDVTDQKNTLHELSERAESFSTLFHGTAEAMVIHDGRAFVLVNEAYASLIGVPVSELIGARMEQYVAPDSRAIVRTNLNAQISTPYEINAKRKDGTILPIELLGRPIRFEGRWLRLLTVRDVSARKEAEQQLKASEARFRALVQDANDMVVVCDPTSRIIYANPALERVLGFDRRQLDQLLNLDLVHPEDRDESVRAWTKVIEQDGARSDVSYRSRSGVGEWVWLEGTVVNHFGDPAVNGLVLNVRDVTEKKRLEAELRHLALHDSLTGLPNRSLLSDRVEQALGRAQRAGHPDSVAVLVLDVDHLASINEAHGHAAGDALLIDITHRLSGPLSIDHTLARIGGDEFVVLLPSAASQAEAITVGDLLMRSMAKPFFWQGHRLEISLNVGIAMSGPQASDSGSLLKQGDNALYQAKRQGRGKAAFYSSDMSDNALRIFTLHSDVQHAAEKKQFELHYQPIFNLQSGKLFKVEALIRWNHPVYGLVMPDEFIYHAEASGHIRSIDCWVVEQVCRQISAWGDSDILVAINLSAASFSDFEIVHAIEDIFAREGVETSRLSVEITEHILVEDFEATRSTIEQMRSIGVSVAIDDFGTGFSSLRYLRDLPVSTIKLDRSFLDGLEPDSGALALVDGIVSLAHALGLAVTGEGIENDVHLTALRAIGCNHGQGYYLGPPIVPESTAPSWLIAH